MKNKKFENYDDNNFNQNNNFQENKPKKKHKKLKIAFIIFCILGVLSACFGSPSPDSITLNENNITMDVNDSKNISFTTDPTDAYTGSLKVKDNKNISATIDDHNIKVKTGSKEGTYKLKIYKDDVNAILVITVVDKAAEEQKKIEEQKAQEEAQRQAELQAQEEARKEAEAQAAAEAQRQAAAQSESSSSYTEATAGQVYIPQNGSKYHSNPNCSNMKNPTAISLSEAQARGYQPCKKCYR